MKHIYTIILLLALSWQAHGQLLLVNLKDLKPGMEHHQDGKIPVFRSALKITGTPEVLTTVTADVYHPDNLLAVVDGQLVSLAKEQLAISNGFRPFRNLMNISNGFLQLNTVKGIGVWNDNNISNGYLYFSGFADLASLHTLRADATSLTSAEADENPTSSELVSSPGCSHCDDEEYQFKLWVYLQELNSTHNPWDTVTVIVDGMMVEMSAGALGAHLNNGAYRLGGGDGRMPEFP